ncbi:glycine cleavage system H-protein subunit [Coemansia spiralis]|uniref:Glycine cleavage system H protein n=2 Tax=Coemansia TaxID=4863 RepID=A0A9W8G754_9FUNG|nr:glycine cleavage H-protein-domain-containing protein [Coemansia spiralis]KAJ1994220.1 glycine cleavage system H-protein subunit [Coemansia umbellata]KAJ2621212.1 glycine cleavage system H-protein subunit [Coemansia sp. RSA 1358]KAJ2676759.1 glycine cleavage system H-protein subunit [Coemansia spiralis]
MSLRLLTRSFISQRISSSRLALPRFYATKKYTESHEWVSIEDGVGTIGITDYAQNALGDVVYVEVPEVDSEVELDETVGVVESVKSTSDIYTPLSGTIVAANKAVVSNTKLINKSPETDGWLFKVKFSSQDEVDALLNEADYKKLIEEPDH